MQPLCTACCREIIFRAASSKLARPYTSGAASRDASLARRRDITRILRSLLSTVRFHETINGRRYVIEALPVGPGRWRAQIAQVAGTTTALMPFYGATPDEAVRHLSVWLARAAKPAS